MHDAVSLLRLYMIDWLPTTDGQTDGPSETITIPPPPLKGGGVIKNLPLFNIFLQIYMKYHYKNGNLIEYL